MLPKIRLLSMVVVKPRVCNLLQGFNQLAHRYKFQYTIDLVEMMDEIECCVDKVVSYTTYTMEPNLEPINQFKNLQLVNFDISGAENINWNIFRDWFNSRNSNIECNLLFINFGETFIVFTPEDIQTMFQTTIFSTIRLNSSIQLESISNSHFNSVPNVLTEIHLSTITIHVDTLNMILENSPKLKTLDIYHIKILPTPNTFDNVFDMVLKPHLDLESVSINTKVQVSFNTIVSFLNEIQSKTVFLGLKLVECESKEHALSLSIYNPKIQNYKISIKLHGTMDFNISDIWISKNSLTKYEAENINVLDDWSSLEHLECSIGLDTTSLENLLKLNLPNLIEIDVNILDKTIPISVKFLESITQNKYLKIIDLHFIDAEFLCSILYSNHPTIETLHIGSANIKKLEELYSFKNSLKLNRTLTKFYLYDSNINFHWNAEYNRFQFYLDILNFNSTLRYLSLPKSTNKSYENIDITQKDLDDFQQLLKVNHSIIFLKLFYILPDETTHLTQKLINMFAEKEPFDILEEFECQICKEFVSKDVVLENQCGKLFCKMCIQKHVQLNQGKCLCLKKAEIFDKVPLFIRQIIDGLLVYCNQCDSLKQNPFLRNNYNDHQLNHCKSNKCVNVDRGCKELLIKSEIQYHQCDYSPVECGAKNSGKCTWVGIQNELDQHQEQCSNFKLSIEISNLQFQLNSKKERATLLQNELSGIKRSIEIQSKSVQQLKTQEIQLTDKLKSTKQSRIQREYYICSVCNGIVNRYSKDIHQSSCAQYARHDLKINRDPQSKWSDNLYIAECSNCLEYVKEYGECVASERFYKRYEYCKRQHKYVSPDPTNQTQMNQIQQFKTKEIFNYK
ncbi:hypothetical protein DLAC_04421 [Tieghemostelium lacteum]|uniref:RING-type domain-containing protein n=1 Tax=Tieghemostelium lacteum TaxID=361077 RepID=A0A151ZJP4_TIELA|nr:hypothetical protein DLAC_04421 [Tieghemostelium lacteum]|eukprot:KYQ94135.1 hypothetical protein DLAC_04421 [Tieghemostelium lacteum]